MAVTQQYGSLYTVLFTCLLIGLSSCVWPYPQRISTAGSTKGYFDPTSFKITVKSLEPSPILQRTVENYTKFLFPFATRNTSIAIENGDRTTISSLQISISDADPILSLQTNVTYTIRIVLESSQNAVAYLHAVNCYGAQYGLETFFQLITMEKIPFQVTQTEFFEDTTRLKYYELWEYFIEQLPLVIEDRPRFIWRGIMVDTARQFFPVEQIYRLMDAMSYNKLNVFHWHFSDHESFSLQLKKYPELKQAQKHPSSFYSASEVKEIIRYAKDRGIIVVPEFNVPGHFTALGKIFPNFSISCPQTTLFNFVNDDAYTFFEELTAEIAELFNESEYFHIGGDEIAQLCFPQIIPQSSEFLKRHNLPGPRGILQLFINKTTSHISSLGKTPVVWQQLAVSGYHFPLDVIFQSNGFNLANSTKAGGAHRTIISQYWDLTYDADMDQWDKFYLLNRNITRENNNNELFMGGETLLWTSLVDPLHHDTVVWPRAAAMGEALWSAEEFEAAQVVQRLDSWMCSMMRRGFIPREISSRICLLPRYEHAPFVHSVTERDSQTSVVSFTWSKAFLSTKDTLELREFYVDEQGVLHIWSGFGYAAQQSSSSLYIQLLFGVAIGCILGLFLHKLVRFIKCRKHRA